MSEYVIPAIVFRVEKFIPMNDIHALITNIKIRCRSWSGTGEYKAVLSFVIDPLSDNRRITDFGPVVPYDREGMDQLLTDIPELTSVIRHHKLDLIDGNKRKRSGAKPAKAKPDPALFPFGWDITKVAPGLQHMHDPEARDEARKFAELLKGYPFADKTPRENQTFIEMEVIAVLEDQYPNITAVDIYLNGAVVRELRVIADPDNQSKLGESVTWFRCQFTNHPTTFAGLCKSATDHLAAERRRAATAVEKQKPQWKPQGIVNRYNESILENGADYIVRQAV